MVCFYPAPLLPQNLHKQDTLASSPCPQLNQISDLHKIDIWGLTNFKSILKQSIKNALLKLRQCILI